MLIINRRALIGGISATCLARNALAQEAQRPRVEQAPEYKIFSAPPETHVLSRVDIEVDGHGYRLFRALPKAKPPKAGWASIWMLDGNSVFNRIQAEDLVRHPDLAVFGIGYPVEKSFDTTARSLDYTPPGPPQFGGSNPGRPTGGADAFRQRLLGPLRKAAEAKAKFDPARRTLWGHSYGGLFTLHCLLSAPDSFTSWVPVSASSGFSDNTLRQMMPNAPHVSGGKIAKVRIMLGDSEHRRGTEAPTDPRPSPETIALADMLKTRPDLNVDVTVFKGLGHGQTFTASFPAALDIAAA